MTSIPVDHVVQPPDSKLCGQACVAMVLGCSLDDAWHLMPWHRATHTRDLVAALERNAADTRMRTVRAGTVVPEPAIVRIFERSRGRSAVGHLVLFCADKVHDPAHGVPLSRAMWERLNEAQGWAVASYLRVRMSPERRPAADAALPP
jgi:hypothetical protein